MGLVQLREGLSAAVGALDRGDDGTGGWAGRIQTFAREVYQQFVAHDRRLLKLEVDSLDAGDMADIRDRFAMVESELRGDRQLVVASLEVVKRRVGAVNQRFTQVEVRLTRLKKLTGERLAKLERRLTEVASLSAELAGLVKDRDVEMNGSIATLVTVLRLHDDAIEQLKADRAQPDLQAPDAAEQETRPGAPDLSAPKGPTDDALRNDLVDEPEEEQVKDGNLSPHLREAVAVIEALLCPREDCAQCDAARALINYARRPIHVVTIFRGESPFRVFEGGRDDPPEPA